MLQTALVELGMTIRKYLLKLLNGVSREDSIKFPEAPVFATSMTVTTQDRMDETACHKCKKIFKSPHGLAIHNAKMH